MQPLKCECTRQQSVGSRVCELNSQKKNQVGKRTVGSRVQKGKEKNTHTHTHTQTSKQTKQDWAGEEQCPAKHWQSCRSPPPPFPSDTRSSSLRAQANAALAASEAASSNVLAITSLRIPPMDRNSCMGSGTSESRGSTADSHDSVSLSPTRMFRRLHTSSVTASMVSSRASCWYFSLTCARASSRCSWALEWSPFVVFSRVSSRRFVTNVLRPMLSRAPWRFSTLAATCSGRMSSSACAVSTPLRASKASTTPLTLSVYLILRMLGLPPVARSSQYTSVSVSRTPSAEEMGSRVCGMIKDASLLHTGTMTLSLTGAKAGETASVTLSVSDSLALRTESSESARVLLIRSRVLSAATCVAAHAALTAVSTEKYTVSKPLVHALALTAAGPGMSLKASSPPTSSVQALLASMVVRMSISLPNTMVWSSFLERLLAAWAKASFLSESLRVPVSTLRAHSLRMSAHCLNCSSSLHLMSQRRRMGW